MDAGFVFLVERAGGGDILVLRTDPPGDDAYDPYIYGLSKCHSVSTLIVNETIANEQDFVIETILKADGLFFAGGDQYQYYKIWGATGKGKITNAINTVVSKNVPVGGTSAGMAVLGSIVFTAQYDTVTSEQCLNDPLNKNISLVDDFLVIYPRVRGSLITDMHFVVRNRMGRLIAFLANALNRGFEPARGFACNEVTSFLLDKDTGVGYIYYM